MIADVSQIQKSGWGWNENRNDNWNDNWELNGVKGELKENWKRIEMSSTSEIELIAEDV